MDIKRRNTFTGSNNIAKPDRLPEGAVADAVNVDFTVGGKAELRAGFNVVEAGVTDAFEMGNELAVMKGNILYRWRRDGTMEELVTLCGGDVAAAWHNNELFLSTLYERLRIGADGVKQWSQPPPAMKLELIDGVMPPGVYQVAMTAVVDGIESGCFQQPIDVPEGKTIRVTHNDSRLCRLWVSPANAETLFYQGIAYAQNDLLRPYEDGERLEVSGLIDMPYCSQLVSHQAMLVGCNGSTLYTSEPFYPHLSSPETGWLHFNANITLIVSVEAGLFVCADKTFFLTGIGTSDVNQREVAAFGGVAGSAVSLPDKSVAWFTKYGQAIGSRDGSFSLPHEHEYSPDIASIGAAGYFEHNGSGILLTTMAGPATQSAMRSVDHWDLEIVE